jgi:hypothetical protein
LGAPYVKKHYRKKIKKGVDGREKEIYYSPMTTNQAEKFCDRCQCEPAARFAEHINYTEALCVECRNSDDTFEAFLCEADNDLWEKVESGLFEEYIDDGQPSDQQENHDFAQDDMWEPDDFF